jgi:tetratricopeptide (TPR) repeat protein
MSGVDAARRAREHAESDNLRAAVEWALHHQHADLALSLAVRSAQLTAPERVRWLDASLLLADRADPTLRAEALALAAFGYYVLGDFDRVETLAQRSLDEFVALGDRTGQSKALQRLAFVAEARGENDRARELLEESLELAEATGTTHRWSLHNLAELELHTGNLQRAAVLHKEALQLALDDTDIQQAAQSERGLGDTALAAGDTAVAERHYLRALSLARELDARRLIAYCLAGLASVAARRGQREHAGRLWGASEAFQRSSGIELVAHERTLYDKALAAVAGPRFEHAADATRNAEPNEALDAALAGPYTGS